MYVFLFAVLIVIIAILIILYFDGEFTYQDKIIDTTVYTDDKGGVIMTVYTIQRTYNSNRIKIFKNEIKPLN